MDIRILNGDWATDGCGMPVSVSGEDELIQRALIRLRTPLGSFLHDASLGSRFFEIDTEREENADRLAFLFACSALAPLGDKVRVVSANVSDGGDVSVSIIINSQTEVTLAI